MGENIQARPSALRRLGGFVKGRPTSQKVGAGAATALLATAPFGGLSGPAAEGPDSLELGKPMMIGPYRVVIDKVVELPDLKPAVSPKKWQRLIVLDSQVTLTGDRPEYSVTLTNNVHIAGGNVTTVKQSGNPSLYFVEDGTRLSSLNPDVTYRVAFTFIVSGPWRADDITVSTNLVEFREEDKATLDPNAWVSRDEIQFKGTLPVVERS